MITVQEAMLSGLFFVGVLVGFLGAADTGKHDIDVACCMLSLAAGIVIGVAMTVGLLWLTSGNLRHHRP